jgi:membrane associated rhomboid family serine protease
MLAAMHPEVDVPAPAQSLVASVREHNPKLWARMQNQSREPEDAWDVRIRLIEDLEPLQEEMNSLGRQYVELTADSIAEHYAFVPAHPAPISYLTAPFLHGGWLHLIGNMWFLWLAGIVLEDKWGRVLYTIFYLAAGAAALQFWAWMNPGSFTPTLGASGAIAALMGAFLIRFPKAKIHVLFILGFRPRFWDIPAYALLPLWLLREVFYGSMGGEGNVANWAHVGGFVFGVLGALVLRFSGLESKADEMIEAKVNPEAEELVEAKELLQSNHPDEALALLQNYVAAQPEAVDAWTLLQEIYWGKADIANYQTATLRLCDMHARAREMEAAWQYAKNFLNSGAGHLPADTWLALCRVTEDGQEFERARQEYEKLASNYPGERAALMANLRGGQLCLKHLHRPTDALKFYEAASASPVPHLDWESSIVLGLREARAALTAPAADAPQSAAPAPAAPVA